MTGDKSWREMNYLQRLRQERDSALSKLAKAEAEAERLENWKGCMIACAEISGNMKLSKAIERTEDAISRTPTESAPEDA